MVFFIKSWETASLPRSPELLLILTVLLSPFFLCSPVSPVLLGSFQLHLVTFMLHRFSRFLEITKYLYIFSLSFLFTLWSDRMAKSATWQFLLFLLFNVGSGLLAAIWRSVCISKSQRLFGISFIGGIPICTFTICQHGRILIFCTIPSGSLFLFSHDYSCIAFVLDCYIRALCY